jgi:hypothetical protein
VGANGQHDQRDCGAKRRAWCNPAQIDAESESHDVSPWCMAFSETCAIARNPLVQRGCDPKIKSKSLEIGPKRFNAETVGTKYL